MLLLDREMYKGILRISTSILKTYFFYDDECLERFWACFGDTIEEEYLYFDENADYGFKVQLQYDLKLRRDWTCYFVSFHLHDILMDQLHFTELELDCFENLLPNTTGVEKNGKTIKRAYH